MNYEEIPVGKSKNLIGQKFGLLTVLYRTKNIGKQVAWACKCECGNEIVAIGSHLKDGHTKSCGCYCEVHSTQEMKNKIFGRLSVLKRDHVDKKGHSYWQCQCECGNKVIVRRDALIDGKTISCGCYHREISSDIFTIDISGQRFGQLEVLERVGSNKFNQALWKCKCDCGNIITTSGQCLRKGETKSCGCIKSWGEFIIMKLLKENNVFFETQKTFSDCILPSGYKAKFDFWVNNEYIIEFDGIQHFQSGTGWNTEEKLIKTKEYDVIKNEWRKNNNIKIIRIPYYHKNIVIEDLLLKTSKYII